MAWHFVRICCSSMNSLAGTPHLACSVSRKLHLSKSMTNFSTSEILHRFLMLQRWQRIRLQKLVSKPLQSSMELNKEKVLTSFTTADTTKRWRSEATKFNHRTSHLHQLQPGTIVFECFFKWNSGSLAVPGWQNADWWLGLKTKRRPSASLDDWSISRHTESSEDDPLQLCEWLLYCEMQLL